MDNEQNKISHFNMNNDYYKAYEKRYKKVYEYGYLWSSKEPTLDVMETIINENVSTNSKILDLGCGEGRDAIFLLDRNYNVIAVDYSKTVIEKCKELSNYNYNDKFKQFDIINDTLRDKFDFIYSVAVLHMFVRKAHRNKFYKFIYEHLSKDGIALIVSMGDGKEKHQSDISKSFDNVERTILNNNEKINVAFTSCNIVDWNTLDQELLNNNLIIKRKWISTKIPEFSQAMCVVVCKKKNNIEFSIKR